jgi:hypothetical protein
VQRLRSVYCQHYASAFAPDDFTRLFRLPRPDEPAADADEESHELAAIQPIADAVLTAGSLSL